VGCIRIPTCVIELYETAYRKEFIPGSEDQARTNDSRIRTLLKHSLLSQCLRPCIRYMAVCICPYSTDMHKLRARLFCRTCNILGTVPLYTLEFVRGTVHNSHEGDDDRCLPESRVEEVGICDVCPNRWEEIGGERGIIGECIMEFLGTTGGQLDAYR
jgi:hypothetical protein